MVIETSVHSGFVQMLKSLLLYIPLQSNKKEKEAVTTETKNDKELELKTVASGSSEIPKVSATQPSSSHAHSESRRGGGKAVKRCLKNKPAGDKASLDSVGVKSGAGDGSASTSSKPATATRGEQQLPREPSAKRTVVRPPKTTKEEAASPADRDTKSVKSTLANGKTSHTHLPAGRSPQTQRRDGDNRSQRRDGDQDQKSGVTVAASASHTNKTQVRKALTFC